MDGMMRNGNYWRGRVFAAIATALAVAGCSSSDALMDAKPSPTSSSSFTDRFSNFVLGTPMKAAGEAPAPDEIDCPNVEVRQGAATFSQSGPDTGSAALSLRYQANFGRTARECTLRAGKVTMRVGVQGRVIVGPAGATGEVALPVRFAIVKEGVEPKTIWTKFYSVPVTLPPGQTNVPFLHVEEDMTVPMPPGREFDQYVIYVGFDPEGAVLEQKKKPAKTSTKPARPR
jgi:hypothetical protein